VAKIGGIDKGKISKDLLIVQYGIIPVLEDFDFDVHFSIIGYSLVIIRKEQVIFIKDMIGGKFSENLKKEFSLLEDGDFLLFYNLIIKNPDGTQRKINTVELSIGK
jgi:hypothetical protein